ncbi:hypothetical protein EZ428_22350 [Pedobacter frigiditerrae]|uniref:Lipoprotein n=1 Tax=Pedobacter frigiditerrae TaxID=2530452 RepID=A0A4R0MK16_9SPHI|nr:hypothetical protein [Pedobacter frigiditerrae]TCC86950.1 hypothetical protein EZ428_22350 [Pedobacter frigiditerrae]
MKKFFLGLMVCLALGCSDAKQDKVEDAIAKTSDSLNSKLNKLNDTLNKVKDNVAKRIPKVEVNIKRTIPISLQWIGFQNQGKAEVVKQSDGSFTISGEQTNSSNEFLKINGKIKRVSDTQISFMGTIITYVKINNKGVPCEKTGDQLFLKTGDRKYYRLQQMENCSGGKVLDYVDLYDLDGVL